MPAGSRALCFSRRTFVNTDSVAASIRNPSATAKPGTGRRPSVRCGADKNRRQGHLPLPELKMCLTRRPVVRMPDPRLPEDQSLRKEKGKTDSELFDKW